MFSLLGVLEELIPGVIVFCIRTGTRFSDDPHKAFESYVRFLFRKPRTEAERERFAELARNPYWPAPGAMPTTLGGKQPDTLPGPGSERPLNVSLYLYDPERREIFMAVNGVPAFVDFHCSEIELEVPRNEQEEAWKRIVAEILTAAARRPHPASRRDLAGARPAGCTAPLRGAGFQPAESDAGLQHRNPAPNCWWYRALS